MPYITCFVLPSLQSQIMQSPKFAGADEGSEMEEKEEVLFCTFTKFCLEHKNLCINS